MRAIIEMYTCCRHKVEMKNILKGLRKNRSCKKKKLNVHERFSNCACIKKSFDTTRGMESFTHVVH